MAKTSQVSTPGTPEEAIKVTLANLMRTGQDGVRKAKAIVSLYLKGGNERPSMWRQELAAAAQDA